MRKLFSAVSVTAFTALGVFLVLFGVLYASVKEMLPFHAAAIPETARIAARPIYFALMALIGGASAALGGLGLFVTLGAVRRGDRGAAAAVFVAYSVAFLAAAVVAERLAAETGAPTSWHIMGGLMAVNLLALGGQFAARRGGATA